jgi:hypothetical protein
LSIYRRPLQKGLWLGFPESLLETIGRYAERFHDRGSGVGLTVMPGQEGQHPRGTLQPHRTVVVICKLRALLAPGARGRGEVELLAELLSLPNSAAELNLSSQRKRETLFEAYCINSKP